MTVRLAVLDASAVAGGPVTRALECAAAEVARHGARVTQVRLYSVYCSCCSSCVDCRPTGRCASRHSVLDGAADELTAADLLLVGVASSASQRDPRTEALLRRLVGSFAGVYDRRHGEADPLADACIKRAGLISSAPPLLGAAAALGALPYGLAGVWRVLDRAGVEVVATTSVARTWAGPAAWDLTRERAVRLGRTLAADRAARRVLSPVLSPVLKPVPVAPAMHVSPRVA
jgi:hypothetical protein